MDPHGRSWATMDQHTKVDRGWCVLLVWVFRWDAFYYSTRWVSEVSVCVSVCVCAFSLKVFVGIRFAQLPKGVGGLRDVVSVCLCAWARFRFEGFAVIRFAQLPKGARGLGDVVSVCLCVCLCAVSLGKKNKKTSL